MSGPVRESYVTGSIANSRSRTRAEMTIRQIITELWAAGNLQRFSRKVSSVVLLFLFAPTLLFVAGHLALLSAAVLYRTVCESADAADGVAERVLLYLDKRAIRAGAERASLSV